MNPIGDPPESPTQERSEAREAEVRRLTVELAQARAHAQRVAQETAVLQRSAAWALLLRYGRWRRRLIPPHSRRERVFLKLLNVSMATSPRETPAGPVPPHVREAKEFLSGLLRSELAVFLATGHPLRFPRHARPVVSIVIAVHNRAELTFRCLRSLAENAEVPFELIVVDNGSADDTAALLARVEPLEVVRNETNLHFLRACNQAAPRARGEYLLLLNNDLWLLPGSLEAALRTMRSAPDVGAVGAKLVLLDGTLQEAGSIVWQDGSAAGYGRGDSPVAAPYMFQRDVDYCSGAFLLTPRELFLSGEGFDERFAPAYYEEVDYCTRLREQGKRIVYAPEVVAYHFEFGSSGSHHAAIALQQLNHSKFAAKHGRMLASRYPPDARNVLAARHAHRDRPRVLLIDDRVPHQYLGAGFPRSRVILETMVERGYSVTFYPMTVAQERWESVYQDIPRVVEVITGSGRKGLEGFLRERRGLYDVITISRPHNMEDFSRVRSDHPDWLADARIVYDAEAVFALREIARRALQGAPLAAAEAQRLVADEVDLARHADVVACVTDLEAAEYRRRGIREVVVLGHATDVQPTAADFADREHLLFVGAIHAENTPNADSLLWFAEQVLPRVREVLKDVQLDVAGVIAPSAAARLSGAGVRLHGPVGDLRPLYGSRRLFVAPTRFASGVPIKVCEAAAHGLPVVATPLLAAQLAWLPGHDLLVADTPAGFAAACIEAYTERALWERLRANALVQVERTCSRTEFTRIVARLCEGIPSAVEAPRPAAFGGT